jgi:hypothetical protein
MKYLKQIFTLILCLNFVGIFVFSNFINSDTNKISSKIFGSELESEIETESEIGSESEPNLKNHLKYYSYSDYFYFKGLKSIKHGFHIIILSYLNHILEVPTSPPDFC